MSKGRQKPDAETSRGFADRLSQFVKDREKASFGKKIGASGEMVTQYLNGSIPRGDTLFNISKAIGRSVEWLLTGQETDRDFKQGETEVSPQDQPTISSLIELIKEQGKRIDEQKELVSAQGDRITDQGKRIDLVANIAQKAQNDTDFLRDRVASIQDAINNNYKELSGKMKKAAESGDWKALG